MESPGTAPCLFCPSSATRKAGEHIWDDWLNRFEGKPVKDKYLYTRLNRQGNVVQAVTRSRIDSARPVVCDECNNEWMSDLTNEFKATAETIIRHGRSCSLLPLGIATLSTYAFMKAVILDPDNRKPYFSSAVCHHFRQTLEMPTGVQIWLASFRGPKRFEVNVDTGSSMITSGRFAGYEFYVFTYLVGHLVIQLTFPRWTRFARRRPPLPAWIPARHWWTAHLDLYPGVSQLTWPPKLYLDRDGLKQFRDRLGRGEVHLVQPA